MRSSKIIRLRKDAQNSEKEKKQPFFSKAKGDANATQGAFFQPKLTIGKPNDKYEQEADAMANQVVSRQTPAQVQQKELEGSGIQRQAMPEEEEVQAKFQVQREAMLEEEEVQAKPNLQREAMPEEEEVQAKLNVQREAMPEEEEAVQTKSNGNTASPSISSRLSSNAGKGHALPNQTQNEMSSAFGYDFSNVNIHHGQEAAQMSQGLNAQAFTHGKDVYFNEGKYNPESTSGKHLLAHELTHVVQQDPEA